MSILLQRKQPERRVLVRKAGEVEKGKDACLSCAWELPLGGQKKEVRISFSRDNLHVWIDGQPVETTATITDQKYDVRLDFEICPGYSGYIFSDVNRSRTEITNYLFINNTKYAETILTYSKNKEHFKNIRKE